MVCHTQSLKKAKKQVEMPLPILSPIPINWKNGMGMRMGSGISLVS